MRYKSTVAVASRIVPGVTFRIKRASADRRLALMQRIKDRANADRQRRTAETPQDTMDAALVAAEVERIYVTTGVEEIAGLEVDGIPATPEILARSGPEGLFREVLQAVRAQFRGRTEDGNGQHGI